MAPFLSLLGKVARTFDPLLFLTSFTALWEFIYAKFFMLSIIFLEQLKIWEI